MDTPSLAVAIAASVGSLATCVLAFATSRLATGVSGQSAQHRDDIQVLLRTSTDQADSMRLLADMSAESIRLATGTFVFEMRDRFDAALAPVLLGVAATGWGAGNPNADFEGVAIEDVVFHPRDTARLHVTLAVSQASESRVFAARWAELPSYAQSVPAYFNAQGGTPRTTNRGETYELPSDTPLFIDMAVDLDVAALPYGRFVQEARIDVDATNNRPEGVVARIPIVVTFAGTCGPHEDGLGLDGLSVHAEVGAEHRSYLLVKDEQLELAFPTLGRSAAAGSASVSPDRRAGAAAP